MNFDALTDPAPPWTLRMSVDVTEPEPLTSPTRNPIDADTASVPFTPLSDTVTRLLSGTPVSVTSTVLPTARALAVPTLTSEASLQLRVPALSIASLNVNTILCPR